MFFKNAGTEGEWFFPQQKGCFSVVTFPDETICSFFILGLHRGVNWLIFKIKALEPQLL